MELHTSAVLRICSLLFLLPLALLVAGPVLAAEPEIEIEGGTKTLRENIRQHLSLADESCKAPLWRINSLLADAETEIAAAAQALGYYQLEYETKLLNNKNCWGLHITLTPGEPVLVKELRIEILGEGREDNIFHSLYSKPGIKVGNKLNHGRYETLKARFGTLAATHGYFDGEFKLSRITVSVAEKSAIIELVYDTGARYKISQINLTHDILDENFLQRYYNIQPGDYYDTDQLLELKTVYSASNYFSVANVAPDLEALKDNQVPINIELEARKRHAYSIGAGVEADEPRVKLGFEDRYLNRRGHSFSADFSASEIKKEAVANYKIPFRRPAYEFLNIYTGYLKEEVDTFVSTKNTYGGNYTYFQDNKWLQTYALEYTYEESQVGNELPKAIDLLIPSVSLSRTKTDGNVYPLRGWSLLGKLSGSPESLGSDRSFLQFYSRAKYVWGLPVGRVLLRTELGMTDIEDVALLPASVRYFAGGDASVRGYDYKSIGPVGTRAGNETVMGPLEASELSEQEEVIGGNNLLVASVEYDYRFEESNWVVAAFYDMGNAIDDGDFEFKRGVGLGVRWVSPIGPIRIDVAKALDPIKKDDETDGWRLHISMGPDL